MNSLIKVKFKYMLSIITKLGFIVYLIPLGMLVFPLGELIFSIILAFGIVFYILFFIIGIDPYGDYKFTLFMNIYHSKNHGYLYYSIKEKYNSISLQFYENKYLVWKETELIEIYDTDQNIIDKKINDRLDKYYNEKENDRQKKLEKKRKKTKLKSLLSNKGKNSDQKFIKELKKL